MEVVHDLLPFFMMDVMLAGHRTAPGRQSHVPGRSRTHENREVVTEWHFEVQRVGVFVHDPGNPRKRGQNRLTEA